MSFLKSPWDCGQTGIKLGTKNVTAKVCKFYVEKGCLCQRVQKCHLWDVSMYFADQNIRQRKEPLELNLKILKCRSDMNNR